MELGPLANQRQGGTFMSAFAGIIAGLILYFLYRCLLSGFYTVQQNERAIITSFGRATRLEGHSTIELPIAEGMNDDRSEEHTSELQSRLHLVCRLLLEKK